MADEPSEPVELTAEETAVMLGHFAGASYTELSESTGLPEERLTEVMSKLTDLGLIEPPELIPLDPEEAAAMDAAPLGDGSSAPMVHLDLGDDDTGAPVVALDLGDDLPEPPAPVVDLGDFGDLSDLSLDGMEDNAASLLDGLDGALDDLPPGSPEAKARDAKAKATAGAKGEEGAGEEEIDLKVAEPSTEADDETREYRKYFEENLHPLPTDERVQLAITVSDVRLFALCFDPDQMVISRIFENTSTNVEHARLIALHHRTTHGLSELVSRASFAADPLVQRRLIRNPSLNEPMLKRLLGSKRLLDIYKIGMDRDVPERTRTSARNIFRARWQTASPEERVEIVWATEARVLLQMAGLTFDSRTTSILCSKNYASVMLIQNLARFSATPPNLIAHLLRQPLVKRQVHLRNALIQHTNTPAEAKRRS